MQQYRWTFPLALLVAGCPAAAQLEVGDDGALAASSSTVRARSHGVGEIDGRVVAGGPDYKVRFDEGGMSFVPAFGRGAERNFELGFRLESIRRGAAELVSPLQRDELESARPSTDGGRVSYARPGGVVERYDVREEGVEQSFLFPSLPDGAGDLVVRGRIDTDLAPSRLGESPDGLAFTHPELGAVTIGAVTGIDADGRRAPGTLRFDGTYLDLVLPAAFVDDAALPLVLDPLIGTAFTVASGIDEEDPDVAYDASNDLYLVVWERIFSAADFDIRAQRIDSGGNLVGSLIFVESSVQDAAFAPSVANINLRDAFVVAYRLGGDLFARGVFAGTGSVTNVEALAIGTGVSRDVDLGGESTLVDDDVLAVWTRFDSGVLSILGAQITISSTGTLGVFDETVLAASDGEFPAISKSGGPDGRYLVVWERDFVVDTDLRAAVVDRNLTVLDELSVITSVGVDERDPDCDGDGTDWIVAFERPEGLGADDDVLARAVSFDAETSTLFNASPEVVIEDDGADDEEHAAVSFVGDSYLIAYQDEVTPGTYDLFVQSVQSLDCLDCEGELAVALGSTNDERVEVASRFSGDPSLRDGALIVWEEEVGLDSEVTARRFEGEDGSFASLGGGCGEGGRAAASCAAVGNGDFRVHLRGGAPFAQLFLALSPSTLGISCGGCQLIADPFEGFLLDGGQADSRGNGSVGIAIPNDAGLAGLSFFAQWASDTGSAPAACGLFDVDLSDALVLQIQ